MTLDNEFESKADLKIQSDDQSEKTEVKAKKKNNADKERKVEQQQKVYDTIVVGAGISGIAAALK